MGGRDVGPVDVGEQAGAGLATMHLEYMRWILDTWIPAESEPA
jgi:hypothetical protein